MTRILILLGCVSMACSAAPIRPESEPVMRWMAGTWVLESDAAQATEFWSRPVDGKQFGSFRLMRKGRPVLYELFTVENDGSGAVLKMRHFHAGLKPWKSEAAGPREWRLAASSRDLVVFRSDSSEVSYRRDGRHLVVRVAPVGASESKVSRFRFRRG